jgi:hypothetical protein
MTVIDLPTSATLPNDIPDRRERLNDIRDRLDLDIDFVRGLVSAIDGLECLDETSQAGVAALAEVLIEQLVEVAAAISDAADGVAPSRRFVPWRRTTDALFRAGATEGQTER